MRGIVNQDAEGQHNGQRTGQLPKKDQAQNAQPQPAPAKTPDDFRRDLAGWNGPGGTALPVKVRIEGVVQKHSARVKRAHAEQQQRELPIIAAAAQPPAGQAV